MGHERDEQSAALERWALSVDETAVVLGVSRAGAYRMVRAGALPSIRLGQRILVPVERLRAEVLTEC
ncbi:MAG: helix-turn-helix domain-containing protein, partial [Acidimicrobiales bacterium]